MLTPTQPNRASLGIDSSEPERNCPLCPRLVEFRQANRTAFPDFFNAPVPSFGTEDAKLLIVGLAPGLRGANRTGRPFTGDFAGLLLYATLLKFGFASGEYGETPNDGLRLHQCMITNGVRCVPPANKPERSEIEHCRQFLTARIKSLPNLQAIITLGRIAHDTTLRALGLKLSAFRFAHNAAFHPEGRPALFASYHCSRYNTNTGVLTTEMFEAVFQSARLYLDTR